MNASARRIWVFESGRRVCHSLPGEVVVLDVADLVLADREAVRFLGEHEAGGRIVLRNCPAYIRRWLTGDDL